MSISYNVLWVQNFGGTLFDVGLTITVDASGNIYVIGYFSGIVTLGDTTLTGSEYDPFIAKLESSGKFLWAQKLGSDLDPITNSITIDSSGNSYIIGSFFDPVTFGNITLTTGGESDGFITKLDSSGNFLWAQKLGGTSDDTAIDISVDSSGNSYVTGNFSGTAIFGDISLIGEGIDNVFITKLDSNGNFLWVQNLVDIWQDSDKSIATDAAGNSYVTGSFSGTVTFGNITLTTGLYTSSGCGMWVITHPYFPPHRRCFLKAGELAAHHPLQMKQTSKILFPPASCLVS